MVHTKDDTRPTLVPTYPTGISKPQQNAHPRVDWCKRRILVLVWNKGE